MGIKIDFQKVQSNTHLSQAWKIKPKIHQNIKLSKKRHRFSSLFKRQFPTTGYLVIQARKRTLVARDCLRIKKKNTRGQ